MDSQPVQAYGLSIDTSDLYFPLIFHYMTCCDEIMAITNQEACSYVRAAIMILNNNRQYRIFEMFPHLFKAMGGKFILTICSSK